MTNHRKKGNEAVKNGDYITAWNEYTYGLTENPKDPALWCNRALVCLKSDHPELATVDAQRAQNLLLNSEEDASQQKLLCKAKYRYAEALAALKVFETAANTLNDLITNYEAFLSDTDKQLFVQNLKIYQEKAKKIDSRLKNQGIFNFTGCYPWDFRPKKRTSSAALNELRQRLHILTLTGQKPEDLFNRLNPTLLVVDINLDDNSSAKQLGIVANANLENDKLIIQEEPFLQAHNYQKQRCNYCLAELEGKEQHTCKNSRCIDIWCRPKCYDKAIETHHELLCGKIDPATNSISNTINYYYSHQMQLILRLFAIAKKRNKCPLDLEEIQYLGRRNNIMVWEQDFIANYDKTIQLLKISPYDLRFDFWVYITCIAIVDNNAFGDSDYSRIYPITSLVNHSCEPNTEGEVGVEGDVTSNSAPPIVAKCLVTTRDIKKGEQIFVSYIEENMSKVERQNRLHRGYGFECKCPKCQRED